MQLIITTDPSPNNRLNVGLEYVPVIAMSMRFSPAIDKSATKSPAQFVTAKKVAPKNADENSVMNPINDMVSTTKLHKNQIHIQEATKQVIEYIVTITKPGLLNLLIKIKPRIM